MEEDKSSAILEELRYFRWILYHHGNSIETGINAGDSFNISEIMVDENEEIIGSLIRYHCEHEHNNAQKIAEEIVIAEYDLNNMKCYDVLNNLQRLAPWIDGSGELPSIRDRDEKYWDLNRLFICLIYGNEPVFVKGLLLVAEERPEKLCKLCISLEFLLFQLTRFLKIKSPTHHILTTAREKLLLLNNPVINNEIDEYYRCLQVFRRSIPETFGFGGVDLIEWTKVCSQQIFERNVKKYIDFEKCLEVLIDFDEKIIRECNSNSRTALHYAVQRKDLDIITKLLNKGAYIGMDGRYFNRKYRKCLNIDNLNPQVLTRHFDKCISIDNNFIEIDFKNLISPPNESIDFVYPHEMNVIEFMSESSDYRHLITHPLISSFVALKWNRLACVLYIDFILHMLFTISTMIYVMFLGSDAIVHSEIILYLLWLIVWSLTIYVAARRIMQQMFWSRQKIFENYWQCVRTASTVIFVSLILFNVCESDREIFATICILVTTIELFIQAGSLFWDFSKYYVMFLDVAWSSIKSLQLCVVLLPAFTVSFYLLLRNNTKKQSIVKSESSSANVNDQKDMISDETSNPFSQFGSTFMKIVVMSTGEFDAGASNFDLNAVSLILFICFLFLISTVFMNLMNGLAVGDTAKIQCDAEMVSMEQRCRVLARYEDILKNQKFWLGKCSPRANRILMYLTGNNSLDELSHPLNTKIYISPKGHVVIAPNRYKGTSYEYGTCFDNVAVIKLFSWVSCIPFLKKRLHMDENTICRARSILERKDTEQCLLNCTNGHLKCRIVKLESNLEKMMEMIKQNEEITRNQFKILKVELINALTENGKNDADCDKNHIQFGHEYEVTKKLSKDIPIKF